MMKLKEIEILEVSHANVFVRLGELESIDMILDIGYEIDRKLITDTDCEDYCIDKSELESINIEEEFASYMMVNLEDDIYSRMESVDFSSLGYIILSDMSPGIEEDNQEISDSIKIKAYNLIRDYVRTDKFKDELKRELSRD